MIQHSLAATVQYGSQCCHSYGTSMTNYGTSKAGLSEPGMPGVHLNIFTSQLTLYQLGVHIMASTLILPPPRIFRPSYGPVHYSHFALIFFFLKLALFYEWKIMYQNQKEEFLHRQAIRNVWRHIFVFQTVRKNMFFNASRLNRSK